MTINLHPAKACEVLDCLKRIAVKTVELGEVGDSDHSTVRPDAIPPMLHGEPGIGKSSLFRQTRAHLTKWAQERAQGGSDPISENCKEALDLCDGEIPLIDLRLTQIESVDLRGLPMPQDEEKRVVWYRPEFLPQIPIGILLLDEITTAEQRLQASAYSLLLDRRVGEHVLPSGWMVGGAGNTIDDGAIVHEMSSALADRMVHFKVVPDSNSWLTWAATANVDPRVIAFIKARPNFFSMNEQRVENGLLVAPSPRGWERCSYFLRNFGHDQTLLRLMVSGQIGDKAADEFLMILDQLSELTAVEDLLAASDSELLELLPKTTTGCWHLVYALNAWIHDADSTIRAFEVLKRLPEARFTENVAAAELVTLGVEVMGPKALDVLGVGSALATSEVYQTYQAERMAQGLE